MIIYWLDILLNFFKFWGKYKVYYYKLPECEYSKIFSHFDDYKVIFIINNYVYLKAYYNSIIYNNCLISEKEYLEAEEKFNKRLILL